MQLYDKSYLDRTSNQKRFYCRHLAFTTGMSIADHHFDAFILHRFLQPFIIFWPGIIFTNIVGAFNLSYKNGKKIQKQIVTTENFGIKT
jgi:hypothetical protein